METVKRIYRLASAMKTGVVLLVLIGLASALGSAVFPDSFFDTGVFRALILLLFLNMALCTFNRLAGFTRGGIRGTQDGKLRLRKFGLLLLHAGMVLVLAGGAGCVLYGQSAGVSIREGDTVDVSKVMALAEPFSLRLDGFEVEFNQDGSPSQYYSHVAVLEDGGEKGRFSVSVNHPLEYGGVKFYQEGFGYLVGTRSMYGDLGEREDLLKEGEFLRFPGTERKVKVYRYVPNFDPSNGMNSKTMRPDNPRVIISVYHGDELLGVGAAEFNKVVEIDKGISVVFTEVEPYTMLKTKSDPGLPAAAVGGILLMTGVMLALIFSPVKPGKDPGAGEGQIENTGR
ncbi:MAG: hypothetical protein HPY50_11350 [Firmicutes bacterium]|nr:hypothetical protein [Bacillota bacterium]